MTITDPTVRRWMYAIYAVASITLGSIFTFCGASDVYRLPDWVQPASAALAYIGGAVGLVAGAHTSAPELHEHQESAPTAGLDEGDVPAA